jgi:hypothetical protein
MQCGKHEYAVLGTVFKSRVGDHSIRLISVVKVVTNAAAAHLHHK